MNILYFYSMGNGTVQAEKLIALMRGTLTETQQQQLDEAGLNAEHQFELINQFELVAPDFIKQSGETAKSARHPRIVYSTTPSIPVSQVARQQEEIYTENEIPVTATSIGIPNDELALLRKAAERRDLLAQSLQDSQESSRQKDIDLDRLQSKLTKAQLQPSPDQLAQRLAPLLSTQLDLPQLTKQALDGAVARAAETNLAQLLTLTHQRIDAAHGPAIVTRRWFVRLQWGFFTSLLLVGLLTGLLVLSYHRAAYFSDGFYKYETVRYRALLPGYQAYNSVYRDVEGLWAKPNFMDRLAGIEALYNRIGKPEFITPEVGVDNTADVGTNKRPQNQRNKRVQKAAK